MEMVNLFLSIQQIITKISGVPKVLKQKAATAWVDGDNSLGVVVGNYCTDLAVELAKQHGIGWVVAKNSNHYGIAAYYPMQMAQKHGLVVNLQI